MRFPNASIIPRKTSTCFRCCARAHASAAGLIDALEREHERGAELVRTLEQALARYTQGGADEFPRFLAAVESYADFHWKHMRTEEKELLPLAQQYLTVDDWQVIDAAFVGNTDPLLGAEAGVQYQDLFRRIVNLAPPPIGVGPVVSRTAPGAR